MLKGLEGFRAIEVGGVAAMPLAGMLLSTWGAEVIHVEPPGRGDMLRQHLWAGFCKALDRPELENHPRFATYEARAQHAEELVGIIEGIFCTKTYVEWVEVLKAYNIIWSPLMTPLEVTQDEQALANDFFVDWDHPRYGKIKVLNNPIKLSKTPAEIIRKAPDLGEHTDMLMKELGYDPEAIAAMKKGGVIA